MKKQKFCDLYGECDAAFVACDNFYCQEPQSKSRMNDWEAKKRKTGCGDACKGGQHTGSL